MKALDDFKARQQLTCIGILMLLQVIHEVKDWLRTQKAEHIQARISCVLVLFVMFVTRF